MNVSGKDLSFFFDGVERAVESVGFDADFAENDGTDSSVPSPATVALLGRAKRTSSISAFLREANGADINSGTLTKDVTYIVTLGTVDGHVLGEIFTSDGTEIPDAGNTVAELGAILKGQDMSISIGGSSFPITSFKYSDQYGEFDATTTDTVGDATEFIAGRAKRSGTIELIMDSASADKLTSSPAEQSVVITFGAGITISGNLILKKKSAVANAAGDMVKVTYDFNMNGTVTYALPSMLEMATSKAVIVVFKEGATTDKGVSGNGIMLSFSIDADVSSLIKASYSMNWIGAVAETVAD